jgi:Gpi18-like mannosyltransferase
MQRSGDKDVGLGFPRRLALIVAAAVGVRVALFPLHAWLPNGFLDESAWKYWMQSMHQHGVLNIFRTTTTDYVGYHWVLWVLSLVYALIGGTYTPTAPALRVLVKTPPLIFDVALILITYAATSALVRSERAPLPVRASRKARRRLGVQTAAQAQRLALVAAAVIAFQPAMVYDSAVWAQNDAAVAATMLAAVVLASRGRPATAWSVWILGCMLKPQPVVLAPVLVVLALRAGGPRALLRSVAAGAAVALTVLAPWLVHGDAGRIRDVYDHLFFATYPRLSGSAWNIWWLFDLHAAHHSTLDRLPGIPVLSYRTAGTLLSAAAAAIATGYLLRRPGLRGALIAAAYLAFAFYAVPVSSHERYLYPFFALLLPVVVTDRRWLWLYVPASALFFANLFFAAPPLQSLSDRLVTRPFTAWFAACNIALFCAFTAVLVSGVLSGLMRRRGAARVRVPRRTVVEPVREAA